MHTDIFTLVILGTGSHIYSWTALDLDPPVYACNVAGKTGKCYHTQFLLFEMESCEPFAQTGLDPHYYPSLSPK
jgi:hypothetical protein